MHVSKLIVGIALLALVVFGFAQSGKPKDIVNDDYIIKYAGFKQPPSDSELMARSSNDVELIKSFFTIIGSGPDNGMSITTDDREIYYSEGGARRIKGLTSRAFIAYVTRGQILVITASAVELIQHEEGRSADDVDTDIVASKDVGGYCRYLLKNTLKLDSVKVAYRGLDGKKVIVSLYG